MVGLVNKRLIRPLVCLLVAGQLLLSAPMVPAMAPASGSDPAEMPCADSMPRAADTDSCPCCPDGVSDLAACLSACAASVGSISSLVVPVVSMTAVPTVAAAIVHVATAADPPLKPPPIV